MASIVSICAALIVMLAVTVQGVSINCYDCTNLLDKKCGVSFDFSGTEGDKYIVKCEGTTVACRKVETTDTHKAQTVVIRSCWNSTGVEELDEDFLDCTKMASIGKACYCNEKGDKPCNGGNHIHYTFLATVTSVLIAILAMFA